MIPKYIKMLTRYVLQISDVNSIHISTLNNPTTDSLLVYSTKIRTNPLTNAAQVYADFSSGNYYIHITTALTHREGKLLPFVYFMKLSIAQFIQHQIIY
jgi:hypothetical protein